MGYHTGSDVPNYWSYAKDFVLQDHMFEPSASFSLPAHLFMVSEWSASCAQDNVPSSCTSNLVNPQLKNVAWTDLTYLLHKQSISWGYYVAPGLQPDCSDPNVTTVRRHDKARPRSRSGIRFRISTR